jgi:hypothetical protein
MPNIWTHFLWGEEVLKRLELAEKVLPAALLPGNTSLFRFGCQGPDLLFYHRFYPWMKRKAEYANRLGSLMHQARCGVFLRTLLQRCSGRKLHEPLPVYTLGFLAHHVLDRNAHPFVFARQGQRSRDHQRLETALDTVVAERLRGIDTRTEPVAPYLYCGPKLPAEVADALSAAAKEAYPEAAGGVEAGLWEESYRDMLAAVRLFHDPYGVKQMLTGGAIEPFVPGRRRDPDDAANERRDMWRYPAEQEKTSQDTFWNVWSRSLLDGDRVVGAAARWLEATSVPWPDAALNQELWEQFVEALGDLSYETGLACES